MKQALILVSFSLVEDISDYSFQENVSNDAAGPAASIICLFPSPFIGESGGDD